jgi:hypothetical protein
VRVSRQLFGNESLLSGLSLLVQSEAMNVNTIPLTLTYSPPASHMYNASGPLITTGNSITQFYNPGEMETQNFTFPITNDGV